MATHLKNSKTKVILIAYRALQDLASHCPSNLLSVLSPSHSFHFSHTGLLVAYARQVPASLAIPLPGTLS